MSFAAGTADPTMVGPLPSKKGSDLTEVLPLSCHSSFEDALDFVYSENQSAFEVPACKALLLLKVADIHALMARVAQVDLGGSEAFSNMATPATTWMMPARQAILPPGVPQPLSTEIDFCFHYTGPEQYACGEAIRSQPKRIGDVVLRVLVFPSGTDTGVARGSLSIFLEAVPQVCWPRDWEFASVRYAIACFRWPTGSGETWAAKRKGDLWTFKANRLDRGWHDFLSPGEVHRYLGPEGFICIRGAIEPECLPRCFLLGAHGPSGPTGGSSEISGSSASRRSWAPRAAGLDG